MRHSFNQYLSQPPTHCSTLGGLPTSCLLVLLLLSVDQRNMVREGTAFLLEALQGDKPEEGPLQTKLLEINLVTNPQASTGSAGCPACTAQSPAMVASNVFGIANTRPPSLGEPYV